ncbi:MAG TPA: radical SAM protein, partial [Terriglobales bacterium]|nr:radical SAM protein [Terriglobales bacterium]
MARTDPTPPSGRSASSSASAKSALADFAAATRPLTARQLRAWLAERGYPAFRAQQVLQWTYRRGAQSFAVMSDVPAVLRGELAEAFRFPALTPEVVARSADDTRKLLFRLDAGTAIESVIIPDLPRLTLCISSQAGCGMGCGFCATARLGLIRNLRADEIVGQVLAARRELAFDERLTNIVFMGMGEPLANYEAIVEAIEMLIADWGVGLSSRRITVSTVGLVPAMTRLVGETQVNL